MIAEHTIETTIHGRYLVDMADGATPDVLLVGFHGYAEQAPTQLERLRAVRGASPIGLVAIQALHRFYRGGEELAASWMTRQDRTLMIADNITYINRVLDSIATESGRLPPIVFCGFSQGASMAYRAAALGKHAPAGVIALGGDIPPELATPELARLPRALVGWGRSDRFYDLTKKDADLRRLQDAGVTVALSALDAGHAWTAPFTEACTDWVSRLG